MLKDVFFEHGKSKVHEDAQDAKRSFYRTPWKFRKPACLRTSWFIFFFFFFFFLGLVLILCDFARNAKWSRC